MLVLKRLLLSQQRNKLKRIIRKTKSLLHFWIHPVTIEEMEIILRQKLGITQGDCIFVISAFGSLNARFSPKMLIELLMNIVGNQGVIMMPYYPPGSSEEWANSKEIFDMEKTISSMGVLTNVFSQMPGVVKSEHPTKAVCVWGKDRISIIEGHAKCKSPFSADSPYGKFLNLHGKSVGLGTLKFTIGHCFEDILNPSLSHYKKPIVLGLSKNGEVKYYPVLIHDPKALRVAPSKFVKKLQSKVKIGYDYSYVIDNDLAFNYYKKEFNKGHGSLKSY